MAFKPAIKRDAKGRVALIGPAGAGKSLTALKLARLLAGPTGRIMAIDTEHGSLSKYAHTDTCGGPGVCLDPYHFEFDVDEFASYAPEDFMSALADAEAMGAAVFLTDSLSHFWMGKDGALEFVDNSQKRAGRGADGMQGWKEFRPHERRMIDAMLASPCHVIVTMRTKNAYENVPDDKGKTKRVKVGLAPVQREGMEYEFDLVGLMDDDNNFIVDKTRCSAYAGKVLSKPGAKEFTPFQEWLKGAKIVAPAAVPPTAAAAAPAAAPQRATQAGVMNPPTPAPAGSAPAAPAAEIPEELKLVVAGLSEKGGTKVAFDMVKRELLEALPQSGGIEYVRILQKHGIKPAGPQQITKLTEAILEIWKLAQWAKEAAAAATTSMQEAPEPEPAGDVIDMTMDPAPAVPAHTEAA